MSNEGRKMTSRIPVAPRTHLRLRDFAAGLGATQNDAIRYLFMGRLEADEDPLLAGRKFREDFEAKKGELLPDETDETDKKADV